MSPEELSRKLAWLQQWMGREIASRQAVLYPEKLWPMPRMVADATVVIDPGNDKLYPSVNSNHVEHLGTSGLASRRILSEIVDLYRCSDVARFFVYLSPSGQASEIAAWMKEANFSRVVDLAVLWRPAEPVERPNGAFELRLCRGEHAEKLRTVVTDEGDPFGYCPATLDMLGTPQFYTLLATCAESPVATGSLYVHHDLGYLGNGKTLEPFRRQGAQSALIAARVNLAISLGCSDVVSETYRFLETSFQNLRRAGFVELYSRTIYRWEEIS